MHSDLPQLTPYLGTDDGVHVGILFVMKLFHSLPVHTHFYLNCQ